MIKVTHLITGLDVGGAEMMLYKLVTGMNANEFECNVISMTNIGPIGIMLQNSGVKVTELGMLRGIPNLASVHRLAIILRNENPDVVQTWMYHANLLGSIACLFAGTNRVCWGIHHSNLDPKLNKKSTLTSVKIAALLSNWIPRKIIMCSEASLKVHCSIGYDKQKSLVIPNGIDVSKFSPNLRSRKIVREKLEVNDNDIVIGLVARFDPQKDHVNFFNACRIVREKHKEIRLVLCGEEICWENNSLRSMITENGLGDITKLLGRRDDIAQLTTAFDISVSSSSGEGFSNVIGEAMASGVPCVVTDVGDSAYIVDDTGFVVEPKNPVRLAEAITNMIDLPSQDRYTLGEKARTRIVENFDLPMIIEKYSNIYRALLHGSK